jgi:hypothetical protein|tara:strand:- start:7335 stop:7604 length:270 start_codon:yes stop_codon:yes gene_type:complete
MKMIKEEKKIYEIISDNGSYIYLDGLNNVIYDSDFKIILGRINDDYRFQPKSTTVMEQGLTPQMLILISNLIKKKAGIGEKRDIKSSDD